MKCQKPSCVSLASKFHDMVLVGNKEADALLLIRALLKVLKLKSVVRRSSAGSDKRSMLLLKLWCRRPYRS